MIEYPSAVVSRQYGCKIMTARYYIKYDERGDVDETNKQRTTKTRGFKLYTFPTYMVLSNETSGGNRSTKNF